jgi:predicted nucleotidyltransferase
MSADAPLPSRGPLPAGYGARMSRGSPPGTDAPGVPAPRPVSRAAIISSVAEALAEDPHVRAAFLGGSDATGRTDGESDVDLVVVVDDGWVEATFALVHRALEQLSPLSLRWRLPDPTWHGNPQEFLALRDSDPAHFVDLVVQGPTGGERFLEPERHGTPVVLVDRGAILAPTPLDHAALDARLEERLALLRVRFPLFQTLVTRAVHRGFPAEAAVAYQDHTLRPLIEVLRIRHCPERFDFGARYLDRDLPAAIRSEVEALALPASPAEVLEFRARAEALFSATLAELDQRPDPRRP